jgi:hypothetical protein
VVSSETMSAWAEAVISSTARSKAARLAFDGLLNPLSFLTNCSDAARISCSVAGGVKLKRVLMLLHTTVTSQSMQYVSFSAPPGRMQRYILWGRDLPAGSTRMLDAFASGRLRLLMLAMTLCATCNAATPVPTPQHDGAHDFDFLIGDWKAHVRRLPDRLVGSDKWIEFDGISPVEYLPARPGQGCSQYTSGGRRVHRTPRRVLRSGGVEGAGHPGSLRLVRHITSIGAHGTVVLRGRRKDLGSELDLRAVTIAATARANRQFVPVSGAVRNPCLSARPRRSPVKI